MAYQIDRYNNTILTVVEDGTVDQTTDLKFIGKNYAGYGEIQNENFLYLLENFSGANPPPRAVSGQVWFDSSNSKLKFYDGSQWRTTGGAEISSSNPSGLAIGDFWWDTENDQLLVWNGSSFILVGPQNAGEGITQMISLEVLDTNLVNRSIIGATVNDEVIMVVSPTEFIINSTTPIDGFSLVKKGITLKSTNSETGKSSNNFYFWGTASDSDRLGGVLASDYITISNTEFANDVKFNSDLYVGENDDIRIYVEPDTNIGVIENQSGQNSIIGIKNTNENGEAIHSVSFTATGMNPAVTNSFKLGNSNNKWQEVHAASFKGIADRALTIDFNGSGYSGSTAASPNTVAIRDSSANITANLFQGTATQARYADLAEKYTTDQEYPVGTVMAVCSHDDHELELAKASDIVVGVISEKPAYLMNAEASGQAVALKGRVPVRVTGSVQKGQAIYAWQNGVASTIATSGLVGVALESNHDEGEKLVECILKV